MAKLLRVERSKSDATWENPFGKRRTVRDAHNELHAYFAEENGRPFEIVVRAFNDGLGFRYELPALPGGAEQNFVLQEEQTTFSFPGDYRCYVGENENTGKPQNPVGYVGSQESEFKPMRLSEVPMNQVRMLPLLVQTPGCWVLLTESELQDWAGLWLNRAPGEKAGRGVTLAARLSPRPDGQGLVKSAFPRHSPWRTLVIAREPGRLLESDLVLNLASPSVLADSSWIKPGVASWDCEDKRFGVIFPAWTPTEQTACDCCRPSGRPDAGNRATASGAFRA